MKQIIMSSHAIWSQEKLGKLAGLLNYSQIFLQPSKWCLIELKAIVLNNILGENDE